jgi:chromosome segregation ATPase
MNILDNQVKTINDKLQQLVKKSNSLQKENEVLYRELSVLKEKEKDYKSTIDAISQKVNILQAAAGKMTEADQKELEKRINQYVKDIDKCIDMISE